jgi:alanine racemase
MVYAPVVGRVSMDQITVDVTDVPEGYLKFGTAQGEHAGPEVELYSRHRTAPNYLPTLAKAAGSITHELLCRVGARVERVHRYPASSASEAASGGNSGGTAGMVRYGGIGGGAAVAR